VRGDTSLHLPQHEFGRQLDVLRRTHDVISLSEIAKPHTSHKPRAVITFDDAYAGALAAGVTELQNRGLPATVFVAPGFIGGASFWWDRYARADGEGLDPEFREHALNELSGRDASISEWRGEESSQATLPPHQLAATEAALQAAAATGLITYGSHTWSHPNLAALSPDDIVSEVAGPLEWLRARFENTQPFLAYPYGLYNAEAASAVKRAGYDGAFLISGGWVTEAKLHASAFELPRWNVPAGISLRGFEIRTSGAL